MSRRTAVILASATLSIAGLAACNAPSPSQRTEAPSIAGLPHGELIAIDIGVAMGADNRTLTIDFIGGPLLSVTDPCYTAYTGWARVVGQHLDLAVVLVTDVHPPPGIACAAVGVARSVAVVLDTPFLGTNAQDLSDGHGILLERSPGP